MKRLIVNADGFGFGAGATQGILDAIERGGFITSVSVNANFPEAERVGELIRHCPTMSVGVHLNPIVGHPCLPPKDVPTLVDAEGRFHGDRFRSLWRKGRISRAELKNECLAQIQRLRDLAGTNVTHVDSHQNSHLNFFDLFLEVMHESGVRCMRNNASLIGLESERPHLARLRAYVARPHLALAHRYRRYQMQKASGEGIRMADRLITVGHVGRGGKSIAVNWHNILSNLPAGVYEIYCHPAHPDDVLRTWARYVDRRADELRILCDGGLRRRADEAGIELIGFHQL